MFFYLINIFYLQDHQCTLLTNELQKLRQKHHTVITESNNTNSKNNDDFANLSDQLEECSKQNQQLNSTLQKLTVSMILLLVLK